MTYISAILELIKAFISLWKQFKAWKEQKRIEEQEKKEQERKDSADKLKNAETEDDFDRAQDELVNNKP